MKSHTSEFKEEIKTLGKQQSVRITYTLNNEQIILTDEDINSATPNYEASLLKSVMKGLDLDSNTDIPLGTEIKFEYGLLVNGAYEYLNYGNYIVYSSEKQEDTLSYKIKCYDKMLYSMKDYEHIEITYPCTIKEYLIALCNKIGLEFKDSTFANQDREIQNELFMTTNEDGTYSSMGYTYRDVLDQIAETTGGCICLTLDDKVEVRYVNKTINYEQSEKSNIIQFKTEVEEPIILERLEGKSIQATRSGKNKLPYNYYDGNSKTVNGITFTVNKDRSITANGTATANASFSIKNLNSYAIVAGSYKLVGENNAYTKTAIKGSYKKTDGTITYISSVSSFTIPEGATNINIYVVILQGETVNNVTFYPMLLKSTETDLTFEAGGASPSPDYPSPIENVEGKNKFNINQEKEIFGTMVYKYSYYLKPNTKYTISSNCPASTTANIYANSNSSNSAVYINKNQTIQSDENGYFYILVRFKAVASDNSTFNLYEKILNGTYYIQLEEGTVATSYVPYNSLEVKVGNKNLWDNTNVAQLNKVSYQNGIYTASDNDNKSVLQYKVQQFTDTSFIHGTQIEKTISGTGIYYFTGTKVANANFVRIGNNGASFEFIVKYSLDDIQVGEQFTIALEVTDTTIGASKFKNVMLLKGAVQNETYAEHQEQTVYFPLSEGQKLMEGSYLADDGIHHKRKQYTFTGNETFVKSQENDNYIRFYSPIFADALNSGGYVTIDKFICTHFEQVSDYNSSKNCIALNHKRFYITISKAIVTDVTTFKTLLSEQYANGTPVIIEYELATEEIVPYTEAQKTILTSIKTMKGTNIFEFPSDTIISYPINYDTIDEEYINNTNVSFGEKYGAINSIVLARAGESDKIYKKDQASIDENGLCELMISENQFMNFNDRSDYLQELSDKLFGVEYYLNDFTSTGIMYYDLLDVYNVKIGDKTYNCLMLNDEQDITQGLEENIYTERPEKSETDYTKADKTDQKINQTNLIVDKQNQKIEGVISQIGDRSEKTTTITADIDGLNSKVSQIEDVTNETTSTTGILILENCQKGPLLNLKIFGNNTVFKYLYPSDTLYPSNTLYPYGDSRIVVTSFPNGSETGISKIYELGVMDVLRQSGNIRDEFILDQSQAKVIRRINKDGSIKDNEEIEELGKISIDLKQGKNTIQIQNYTAEMYCKYAIQSEYTDIFATKVEMNSSITQASDEINLEVRKKVDENEVISKINQSAEQIQIEADKISLKRKNIKFSR